MTGSCRSWIHYINLRSAHGTQKEHMDIAEARKKVFIEQFPIVSEALGWNNTLVQDLVENVKQTAEKAKKKHFTEKKLNGNVPCSQHKNW